MSGHSILSPSSAARWMRCPGSVKLSHGKPNKGSESADWGTCAHFLGAWCLENGLAHPAQHLGKEITIHQRAESGEVFADWAGVESEDQLVELYTTKVDADMAAAINNYVQHMKLYVEGNELFVEQKVDFSHPLGVLGQGGTADAIVLATNLDGTVELQVHDLKTGYGDVDPEGNEQLQLYALGAFDMFSLSYDITSIRLVIHQYPKGTQPKEWTLTVEDLEGFAARAKGSAAVAIGGLEGKYEPILNPSEKACKWCQAKVECPAAFRFVAETMGGPSGVASVEEFEEVVKPAAEPIATASPTADDIPQYAALLPHLQFIRDWCDAIEDHCYQEAMAGESIPGYKLVAGKKSARAWSSADEAEAIMKSMRLKMDEMYKLQLISPTAAEELLKESPKRWNRLQPLITQSEGKLTLVPESDKRLAVEVKPAAEDFADLTAADDLC